MNKSKSRGGYSYAHILVFFHDEFIKPINSNLGQNAFHQFNANMVKESNIVVT